MCIIVNSLAQLCEIIDQLVFRSKEDSCFWFVWNEQLCWWHSGNSINGECRFLKYYTVQTVRNTLNNVLFPCTPGSATVCLCSRPQVCVLNPVFNCGKFSFSSFRSCSSLMETELLYSSNSCTMTISFERQSD